MYRAQDYTSGYGQGGKKPTTSILPYLRAKEAEKEKAEAGKKLASPTHTKKEAEKEDTEPSKADSNEYDAARLEILRG